MYISKNLKTIRNKFGLTRPEFAEKYSLTVGKVQAYELGRTEPPALLLVALHEQTGIPIYDLLMRELLSSEIPSTPVESKEKKVPKEKKDEYDLKEIVDRIKRLEEEIKKK